MTPGRDVVRLPPRLHPGDQIRVVAPARSLGLISDEVQRTATRRLESMGYPVTWGRHVLERDELGSSSIMSRVEDLHEAWTDPDVPAILTVIGGFNSNQLLPFLNFRLLRDHPKILCGYSDITALLVAAYARAGVVTYYGPHYSSFGDAEGADYTVEQFRRCVEGSDPIDVPPSERWSEDAWFLPHSKRSFPDNPGPVVLQPGTARGPLIGGNLCTLNLLQGTAFLPNLSGSLLFVEDTGEAATPVFFDRHLQSLLHQKGGDQIAALLIGRLPSKSGMTEPLLRKILSTKPELEGVPVLSGLDFGHTTPLMTLPIGGRAEVIAQEDHVRLRFLEH